MNIIFFSPTRTSAKVAKAIASGMNTTSYTEIDLTYDYDVQTCLTDDITIIAAPVYAGRIARTAIERLSRIKGNGSPAVVVALYGNRHYEDALAELQDITDRIGFRTIAAAAFIGEHSYSRPETPIAAGRPDKNDLDTAFRFGQSVLEKLHSSDSYNTPTIPGNRPYVDKGPFTPATPVTNESLCTQCQTCIDYCPTGAISLNDEIESNINRCIKCCACVKICPNEARIFHTPYTALLHDKCAQRREPEIFIA